MKSLFVRTAKLIGAEKIQLLNKKRVAVFGLGGVGEHVAEASVRSGTGEIDLIDNDIIYESNMTRHIIATFDTLGLAQTTPLE